MLITSRCVVKKILTLLGARKRREAAVKGRIPQEFIQGFLPENPIVVEGGAHIGSDTVKMGKLWPKGEIHAFEPVPHLFNQLEANTHGIKNVHCYQLALGEKVGPQKMFISSGTSNGSSSLLPPKEHLTEHPEVLFQTEIEVPVTTLDNWAREQRIEKVDFLWLDIQGAELAVLQAAPNILSSVKAIHAEVSLKEVYEGVPLYAELREWLEQKGFRVVGEALPWPDMGNVLFVRRGANNTR